MTARPSPLLSLWSDYNYETVVMAYAELKRRIYDLSERLLNKLKAFCEKYGHTDMDACLNDFLSKEQCQSF